MNALIIILIIIIWSAGIVIMMNSTLRDTTLSDEGRPLGPPPKPTPSRPKCPYCGSLMPKHVYNCRGCGAPIRG